MRQGKKGSRDGDVHLAAARSNIVEGTALCGDVHAVKAHLQTGNETGPKDLHT